MSNPIEVVFLGTNGSRAFNNGRRARYGTNTLAVAIKINNRLLVIDAGSGICGLPLHPELQCETTSLFLTHYHTDHIEGFMFWNSLFVPGKKITVYGPEFQGRTVQEVLSDFWRAPYNPLEIGYLSADITYRSVSEGQTVSLDDTISVDAICVDTIALDHPDGGLGYRIRANGRVICYLSDLELSRQYGDALLNFAKDSDLLIMDAFFDDGAVKPGWGHSSWKECSAFANACDARQLALYHHQFSMSDSDIDVFEEKSKAIFPNTVASADGLRVTV